MANQPVQPSVPLTPEQIMQRRKPLHDLMKQNLPKS